MKGQFNIRNFGLVVVAIELIFWIPGLWLWSALRDSDAENFQFEVPDAAWGFAIIPVLWLAWVWSQHKQQLARNRFADAHLAGVSIPVRIGWIVNTRYALQRLGFGLLVVALMNPQYGKGERVGQTKMVEIMIALDISNSMLAKDAGNPRDRLSTAKMAIGQFIKSLKGDRVGLVVFAGIAKLQMPMTADYNAAKRFLNSVNTTSVSAQGTDIALSLETCLNHLEMENGIQKTIILISDGENHEEEAVYLAQRAAEMGVILHSVGIGSEQGVPIPEYDQRGNKKGFIKDEDGNTVMSKLNEPMLMELAQVGGGSYVRASGADFGLEALLAEVNSMEKTAGETGGYEDWNDQFYWFLAAAILCFVLTTLVKHENLVYA